MGEGAFTRSPFPFPFTRSLAYRCLHANCCWEASTAAVAAADPIHIVPQHLPKPPKGRTLVIGAGKAAASMALAAEQHWPADAPLDGIVITRYAHGLLTNRISVVEAGHPVPDEAGEAAAKRILDGVRRLSKDDLLLALISGGGSSLLSLPVETISMADLKAVTQELLRCGATIQEINAVRKHLSADPGRPACRRVQSENSRARDFGRDR